jgi:glutamate synthase (NADPH) large chain
VPTITTDTQGTTGHTAQEIGKRPLVNAFPTAVANLEFIETDEFGNQAHDACSVGGIASINGQPDPQILERGLLALASQGHRSAFAADLKSGDGAGILINYSQDRNSRFVKYLRESNGLLDPNATVSAGQFFLPTDPLARAACERIIEETLKKRGLINNAWRDVEVDASVVGVIADESRPHIRQIVIENTAKKNDKELERILKEARSEIEARVRTEVPAAQRRFGVSSLSTKFIIYKALVAPDKLEMFYKHDLSPESRDEIVSNMVLYHTRYATNIAVSWNAVHPNTDGLAHNGEINTDKSTIPKFVSRVIRFYSARFDSRIANEIRIVPPDVADSGRLSAQLGLLTGAGWDLIRAFRFLMPPPLKKTDPKPFQNYVAVTHAVDDPSDGPATIAATDGDKVLFGGDRNAERPGRWVIIRAPEKPDMLVVGSEMGTALHSDDVLVREGIIGPGETVAVDLVNGQFMDVQDVQRHLSEEHPWAVWRKQIEYFNPGKLVDESEIAKIKRVRERGLDGLPPDLSKKLSAVGASAEDVNEAMGALTETAQELVYSMGDNSPPAFLSNVYRRFSAYLRQEFAQVTNPPTDPKREINAFDITVCLGNRGNIIDANPDSSNRREFDLIKLEGPFLTKAEFVQLRRRFEKKKWKVETFDCTFDPREWENLEAHIDRIAAQVVEAAQRGVGQIVLSHAQQNTDHAVIPSALILSAVNTALSRAHLRHAVSLHMEAGDVFDTWDSSAAVSSGADTVVPINAEETILYQYTHDAVTHTHTVYEAIKNSKQGHHNGLKENMSKMGVGTLNSYRGGHFYGALGLSRKLVEKYMPGVSSPISGLDISQLGFEIANRHYNAYQGNIDILPNGGFIHIGLGDVNGISKDRIAKLEKAIDENSQVAFREFSEANHKRGLRTIVEFDGENIVSKRVKDLNYLQDLYDVRYGAEPLSSAEIKDTAARIAAQLFATAPMSHGALGSESVTALNIAMNELGAMSSTGEGGEDKNLPPERKAKHKQVASARFGVDVHYIIDATELQIKIAQGAKPGQGGQVAGVKVTEEIASIRGSTEGVPLISPPPHHDIYSIEDLAQLIYTLKQVNPSANISVKLVSNPGIGTIAAGVVKAGAKDIHVSGYDGGTGAAPLTSIKYTGYPWQLGVSDVYQTLTAQGLMVEGITITTDGNFRTGRDIRNAIALGANRIQFGTVSLIALGCKLLRQCHMNTCGQGIATQDEKYRKRFMFEEGADNSREARIRRGADRVKTLMLLMAQDYLNEIAKLGDPTIRSSDELHGRKDIFVQTYREDPEIATKVKSVDLDLLFRKPEPPAILDSIRRSAADAAHEKSYSFDERFIHDHLDELELKEATNDNSVQAQFDFTVSNQDRCVGTALSGELARRRKEGKKYNPIKLNLHGFGGQGLGVFLIDGVTIKLDGAGTQIAGSANDYVGEMLSGGTLIVAPAANENGRIAIGNTALYGARNGEAYFMGDAGQRFAVRNSGADAVLEGRCGDNGCEYMTNGFVAIMGGIGDNFCRWYDRWCGLCSRRRK